LLGINIFAIKSSIEALKHFSLVKYEQKRGHQAEGLNQRVVKGSET
jgi:hypothetical protein